MKDHIEDYLANESQLSDNQKVLIQLLYTASRVRNRINQWLKPYDLSEEQFNILRILRGAHPDYLTLREIGDRMIDKNSNTSRLVDKLQAKHLVVRTVHKRERRFRDVCITAEGLHLLKQIDEDIQSSPLILHKFNAVKSQELMRLLAMVRSGMEN
jgi:DNA-binding MarR family transcriptional regulator